MSRPLGGTASTDPFFEVIQGGEWNACVGPQGDEVNYIDGYMEAAIELASAVIDKKLYASRDTLAMPILYNGRHALELSLKFAINELHRADALDARHKPDHDILSHWKHLRDSQVGDTMIRTLVEELKPFVTSLSNIDDDGQELRYPETQTGKTSLETVPLVNLQHILKSLKEMRGILMRLKGRVEEFKDECLTGTYTRECSRRDLRTIAATLGAHETWREQSFSDKKAAIREQFRLTSNKFSQAVNKIKESRELGALVGREQPLHHLGDEKAVAVLKLWTAANPLRQEDPKDLGMDYFNRDPEERGEHWKTDDELNNAVRALLTSDELADLETLFDIGRVPRHGENYDLVLKHMKGNQFPSQVPNVNQILSKSSLLENVIRGARLVGRPSLAVQLRAIRPIAESGDAALP